MLYCIHACVSANCIERDIHTVLHQHHTGHVVCSTLIEASGYYSMDTPGRRTISYASYVRLVTLLELPCIRS